MPTKIEKLFQNLNSCSFAGIDTLVDVKVSKLMPGSPRGKAAIVNPHYGRVTKKTSNSHIMVSANKNSSTYVNMIKRRLVAEGKDPEQYQPQERVWGERLRGTPMIKKVDGDNTAYYFEAIFIKGGTSEYFLDGNPIAKEDVIGMSTPKIRDDAQGSLSNMVIVRSFKLESIQAIRTDGLSTIGPFTFTE